jgi:hypothetical protein
MYLIFSEKLETWRINVSQKKFLRFARKIFGKPALILSRLLFNFNANSTHEHAIFSSSFTIENISVSQNLMKTSNRVELSNITSGFLLDFSTFSLNYLAFDRNNFNIWNRQNVSYRMIEKRASNHGLRREEPTDAIKDTFCNRFRQHTRLI